MSRAAILPAASAPIGRARPVRWMAAMIVAALAQPAPADDVGSDDEDGAPVQAAAPRAEPPPEVAQVGVASWYGPRFHGRLTACGEIYDENELTAAHPWLPFGSKIAVTNLENGCRVTLRVTDRGPYHGGRILDCSKAAAEELDFIHDGITRIRWELVERAPEKPRRRGRARKPVPPVAETLPILALAPGRS